MGKGLHHSSRNGLRGGPHDLYIFLIRQSSSATLQLCFVSSSSCSIDLVCYCGRCLFTLFLINLSILIFNSSCLYLMCSGCLLLCVDDICHSLGPRYLRTLLLMKCFLLWFIVCFLLLFFPPYTGNSVWKTFGFNGFWLIIACHALWVLQLQLQLQLPLILHVCCLAHVFYGAFVGFLLKYA